MPKFMVRFNTLVIPLITWLVLLIPFEVYQRYFVSSQQTYLTGHGFRLLSAIGRQLDAYLKSINQTLKAAEDAAKHPGEFQTKFTKANPGDQERAAYLDYLRTFHPELPPALTNNAMEAPNNGCKVKNLWVEFGLGTSVYRQCLNAPLSASARLSLDDPIRDRLEGIGEDYFDDVLIANPKGEVLFQRSRNFAQSSTYSKITRLDYLVSTMSPAVAANPQADNKVTSQTQHEPPSFEKLSESSNVLPVKLGGENYNLFLQPLRLASADADTTDGGNLVICGLWRTQHLDSESFALPYSYVIWFGLLCVAAVGFVWPFLKIRYRSNTERQRRSDGWLILLSIFAAVASVTLMVLNYSYSSDAQMKVDDDLKALAHQIQRNIDIEIDQALMQLAALDALKGQKAGPGTTVLPPLEKLEYPFFESVFWVDGKGDQSSKLTTARYLTPNLNLKDRPYVKAVTGRSGFNKMEGHPRFGLQPILSQNTGLFATAISAPISNGPDGGPGAQVMLTRPLSLVSPVLPADFGFAVLDSSGNVLFHNNQNRNLSENFIDECKDPTELQAALFSRADHNLNIVYSGKERRILVTRLNHLGPEPTTLIVIHNTEINNTINMAIILIGSVLMAIYAFFILMIAVFDMSRRSFYPPEWIWPRRNYSFRYVLVLAVNGVLVIAFLSLYSRVTESGLLFLTGAFLLFEVVCIAVLLAKRKLPAAINKRKSLFQKDFKTTYALAAVSILVVGTVVPCFGFFEFSYDAANELAAKHGQLRVLTEVLDRRNGIDSEYRRLNAPKEVIDKRIESELDRYDKICLNFLSFARIDSLDGSIQQESAIDSWLREASQLFPSSKIGGEMRMLSFEDQQRGKAQPLEWKELYDRSFGVSWENTEGDNGYREEVDSTFQKWNGVSIWGWLVLILIWILLAMFFFRSLMMKSLFFLDMHPLLPLEEVNWQDGSAVTANFLLLSEPHSERSIHLSRLSGIEYIDLRSILDRPKPPHFSKDTVVVLDHFDFDMNKRSHNRKRLEFLEQLIYKDGCRVVLVSSIDPAYYLTDSDPQFLASDPQAAAAVLARWTTVMCYFRIATIKDLTKTAFREAMHKERNNPEQQQLVRWVDEECRHTASLRKIGLGLLRRHRHDRHFNRQTLRTELVSLSDSYYSLVWSALSNSERLVLFQLANDGWANNKNERAFRQLERKSLIRHKRFLRVVNESLRDFIRKVQDQRQIAAWEQQGKQSSWRSLKIGLLATAIGLGAWLFYAQKDLFQGLLGYLLGLGAAIAAITNIVGGIKGRAVNAPKITDTTGKTT